MKHMIKTIQLLLIGNLFINFSVGQTVHNEDFKINKIISTSIVKKTEGGEKQIIVADISALKLFENLSCELTVSSTNLKTSFSWGPLDKENKQFFLEIPVVNKTTNYKYLIKTGNTKIADGELVCSPPRIWKIYDIQVSHHDMGYADYYHFMRRDVREYGIEMALDFCRKTDHLDDNCKFRWTIETSEPLSRFISSQPPAVTKELTARIKQGRIELGALHNSVSTEHLGYELMSRLFYTPNRHIRDLLHIAPAQTALDDDVVGFSRTLPLFLKEAGIPYFFSGYNSTMDEFYPASAEPVFYWKANDGDEKNKPLVRSFPYYSPEKFNKYDVKEISSLLHKYEADQKYYFNSIMAEESYDFSVPQFNNIEGIINWNKEFSNPVLVSGTFSMYFNDMNSQLDKSKIKEYDKDCPNAWTDEDGADAKLMAEAHRLNYDLPAVEKLSTIAYAMGGKGYPWEDIWQSYHKLLMYHEHTNAAFSEEELLTSLPYLKNKKAGGANYYECENVMHKQLVKEAEEFCVSAKSNAVEKLKGLITTSNERTVVVYNPLSYTRTDVVVFENSFTVGFKIIDNETLKETPFQIMPDGKISFIASDIPSVGYKTYGITSKENNSISEDSKISSNSKLENSFYRIAVDTKTGAISSIFDKIRNVELVDQNASYKFNEYLYQRVEEGGNLVSHHPEMVSLSSFEGNTASGITTKVKATGCEWIEQTVTLYNDINRIDFRINLDKSDSKRKFRQATQTNKEAVFYSLPFNIPNGVINHELAGGVVEPMANQYDSSITNYFTVQHFSDISNEKYGITFSTIDAPILEYGFPRSAQWQSGSDCERNIRKPENSHIYIYLMNNMFFTNIPYSQPGEKTFNWSVRSHDSDWKKGKAYNFGWETSHPLEAFIINEKQSGPLPEIKNCFMSIDKDNVICSTIKPAEANGNGFILRFFELTGQKTEAKIKLNFIGNIDKAIETNLIEDDKQVALKKLNNNEIILPISGFGIKTIRVLVSNTKLIPPTGLTASAISDREIKLKWEAVNDGKISHYNIYRSTNAGFKAELINKVASVPTSEYLDKPKLNYGGWLDNIIEPGTNYFYIICAVDKSNNESSAGKEISVKTLNADENNSLPLKVERLHVTNVSPVTDFNYLCLLFYTNCESDISKYRVYRSTEPNFIPDKSNLLEEIDAYKKFTHLSPHEYVTIDRELKDYSMIIYPDESVELNKKYYYKVQAMDKAGQGGPFSNEAHGSTALRNIRFIGSFYFFDEATVELQPVLTDGSEIRYTMDNSAPTANSKLYTGPFKINSPGKIKAAVFYPGTATPVMTEEASYFKTKYPAPKYKTPFSENWQGSGPLTLVNSIKGKMYNDGCFQGIEFGDLDVVMDLKEIKDVSSISTGFTQELGAWVFLPSYVECFISEDGVKFETAGKIITKETDLHQRGTVVKEYAINFDTKKARYVRVFAKSLGKCPEWHVGFEYNGTAWIFADEITVK